MRKAPIAVLVLLLALPAAAQHEHHEGGDLEAQRANMLVDILATDIVVGHPVTFTVMLLTDVGEPRAHQDMRFRVTFGNRTLFEAPATTGHDYDGFNEFTLTFPSAGPWTAELLDAKGKALVTQTGWTLPRSRVDAVAHLVGPQQVAVGETQIYRMWPADVNGSYIKHFYTQFDILDEDGIVMQAKLHGHNTNQVNESVVYLAFPKAGHYTLRAQMFQSANYGPQRTSFAPITTELGIDVTGSREAAATSTTPVSWIVHNGTEPKTAVATIDPHPNPNIDTLSRIAVRAQGKDGKLRTHVDFSGALVDGSGRLLFASDRMHESDGLLQVMLRPNVAGDYTWKMVLDGNGMRIDLPFRVHDGPVTAASVAIEPHEALVAGVPADLVFKATRPDGSPLTHSEVLLQVLDADGRQELLTKLHTHNDGRFPFTYTPLSEGVHTMRLQGFGLGSDPVEVQAEDVTLSVGPGEAWPVQAKPVEAAHGDHTHGPDKSLLIASAAAVATLAVGGLGGAIYWMRRQR